MNFAVIDIVFVVLILGFGIYGFTKGFISQIFSLIGIASGIILGFIFSKQIAEYFADLIQPGTWNEPVAFILIFAVVFLFSKFLQKIFTNVRDTMEAEGADKVMGFFLGTAKGWILCVIITIILLAQPLIEPYAIFEDTLLGKPSITVISFLQEKYPDIFVNIEDALKSMEKLEDMDLDTLKEKAGI